ncbi:hypothetical protein MVEN_01347200 [Mycena venus]|uniref:Uncharacterized protein n=1 Tax=Mycena venus TaxID=2733690 RepID=A0A8H6Y240_9AGAR|nr:hypothetical protein MVEN_01347200 [Mycena venus]
MSTEYDRLAGPLRQIVGHVHRIRSLTIVLSTELGAEVLALFRDVAAPNLQHLEVVNRSRNEWGAVEMFYSGASKMNSLQICGLKLKLPVAPWVAYLTHLELRRGQYHFDDVSNSLDLVALTAEYPSLISLLSDISWIWDPTAVRRFHIPSLKFLHISISDGEDKHFLLNILDRLDTPALTEFVIDGTHGDQIGVLFNATSLPHSSFSALTSLSFVQRGPFCACDSDLQFSFDDISAPPLALFPALSSLSFINQCLTPKLITDILGPASQPWMRLQTVTLCPDLSVFDLVCTALKDAVDSKHQSGQCLPKLRVSPVLFSSEEWQDNGVDADIFDPVDILASFD